MDSSPDLSVDRTEWWTGLYVHCLRRHTFDNADPTKDGRVDIGGRIGSGIG